LSFLISFEAPDRSIVAPTEMACADSGTWKATSEGLVVAAIGPVGSSCTFPFEQFFPVELMLDFAESGSEPWVLARAGFWSERLRPDEDGILRIGLMPKRFLFRGRVLDAATSEPLSTADAILVDGTQAGRELDAGLARSSLLADGE